jgi:hypothetical protein
MMKMYDLLMEDEEPSKSIDGIISEILRSRFRFMKTPNGTEVDMILRSELNHIEISLDILLKPNEQLDREIFLDIFKYVYDIFIKHGIHKLSDDEMEEGYFRLLNIDVKYDEWNYRTSTYAILPDSVDKNIRSEHHLVDLFGSEAFDKSLPDNVTPSYDDLRASKQAELQTKLLIPNNVLPKFPENFGDLLGRFKKKSKSLYFALSKGTYNGKKYTLKPEPYFINIQQSNPYSYHDDNINKQTNTIKPIFIISFFSNLDTYDGKQINAHDFSTKNWNEYRGLLKHINDMFYKYGLDIYIRDKN